MTPNIVYLPQFVSNSWSHQEPLIRCVTQVRSRWCHRPLPNTAQSAAGRLAAGGHLVVAVVGDHLNLHQVLQAVIRLVQLSASFSPSWLGRLHRPECHRNLQNDFIQNTRHFTCPGMGHTPQEPQRISSCNQEVLSHPQLHLTQHDLQSCNVIRQIRAWLLLQSKPWRLDWSHTSCHTHNAINTPWRDRQVRDQKQVREKQDRQVRDQKQVREKAGCVSLETTFKTVCSSLKEKGLV